MEPLTPGTRRPIGRLAVVSAVLAVALGLASVVAPGSRAVTETITITGTVGTSLSLELPVRDVDFGDVTPDSANALNAGVSASTDSDGTTYDFATPGDVIVKANAIWSGQMQAMLSGAMDPHDLSLVTAGVAVDMDGPVRFGTGNIGESEYHHDYRLRVEWADPAGRFDITLVYTVTNG